MQALDTLADANERLVVLNGPHAGYGVPIKDGLKVGRHPLNEMCLRVAGMRAQHAVVERTPEGWRLSDLSGEGLEVAGERVGAVLLRGKVTVRVGPIEIGLRAGAEGQPAPAATHTQTILQAIPTPEPSGAGFRGTTGLSAQQLEAVLSAQAIFGEERAANHLVERLADWVHEVVPSHHTAVLVRRADKTFAVKATRHRGTKPTTEPSRTIVDKAVEAHQAVLTVDAPDDTRFGAKDSIISQNIRAALAVPLLTRGEVTGVVYAATQGLAGAFTKDHLQMISLVAGPAASAIQNAQLLDVLGDTNRDLLRRLSVCARFNDDDTGYHIERVGDYAALIARAMGKSRRYADLLRAAAPMHDIGKLGIPQAILQKPGKLTEEEWVVMRQHPAIGEQILGGSNAPLIQLAAELAGSHHEKWDGSGYPRGLKGEAIPLSGRIVAVADVFDALTTKRPYKPAFPNEKAFDILKEGAGKHFDPKVVEVFFAHLPKIIEIKRHYAALEARSANDAAQD